MKTQDNATPRPWRAALDMDGRHKAFSIMADSQEFKQDDWPYHPLIAQTLHFNGHAPLETAKANAALIVKAVNSHEDLVAALQKIHANAAESPEWIRTVIEAALKKAGAL